MESSPSAAGAVNAGVGRTGEFYLWIIVSGIVLYQPVEAGKPVPEHALWCAAEEVNERLALVSPDECCEIPSIGVV